MLGLVPASRAARCCFPALGQEALPCPRAPSTCSWTRPTPGRAPGQGSRGHTLFLICPAFLEDACVWRGRQNITSWNKSALIMQIKAG